MDAHALCVRGQSLRTSVLRLLKAANFSQSASVPRFVHWTLSHCNLFADTISPMCLSLRFVPCRLSLLTAKSRTATRLSSRKVQLDSANSRNSLDDANWRSSFGPVKVAFS